MNPAAGETDEAYRHFSETLEAELVANVKPVIMSLTMLAEDYSAHSAYIARAIEEYILKVRPELKILGLYLMDSIMKNLKQTTNYIKIFEKNIVSIFCRVFSAVDESQRRALYKLRQTWNVLFTNAALFELDKSVQQLDPAWPITATTSSSSSSSSTTANSRVQQQATTSVIKPVQQQLPPQPQPQLQLQTQPQQQQQQQLKKVPTPTPIPFQTQLQLQPSIEPSTQPSTVPTATTMNKTTVSAPVVRDRDPRLIRSQQQQQPTTVIRSSGGGGQISPSSTKSSESSTDLSIGGGGGSGVKPTQSSSMTAIGATQSTQSSPSKPASSTLVNLKRTSTSDLHPKVEAKKPKMIVVSPPPDKDPTNQILPPPVKPPAASKTTSPKTGAKTAAAAKAKTTTSPSGKTTTTTAKTSATKVPSVLDLELNPDEKPPTVAAQTKKVKNESVVKTVPAKQSTTTTTTTTAVTPASQSSTNMSKAAAIATLKNAAKLQALVSNTTTTTTTTTTTKPANSAATSTTGVKSMLKRLQNTDKIAAAATQQQSNQNQNHTTSTTNHNHNNSHKTSVVDSKQSDDLLQPLSDVDERFGDVDERFIPPTSGSTSTKAEAVSSDPIALAAAAMKNLFESSSSATTSLANITNHPTTSTIITALLQSGTAAAAAATSSASSALTSQTIPAPLPVVSGSGLRQQTSSPPLSRPPRNHDQENSYDQQQENLTAQAPTTTTSTNSDEYVSYEDLPALRPRDSTDSLSDSLLIIDGRQYRLAANTARKLHIYYHDHEVLCDTRSKDVYVDKKRVAKMGDPSKEVTLNGRRVRIMYMGQRVEVWIDGMAYQFRADSPPKSISLPSTAINGVIKRYYVTVDSRTMEMFFNNYRVCQIDPMSTATLSVQLAPNEFEQHEISFVCPPKMIMIDDTPRKMRYDLPVPCIEMPDGYHAIKFDSPTPKSIFIDDLQFVVPFNRSVRIRLNGRAHELAWGGPGFEVIIDGRPYELQFDKSPREILIGMRTYSVCIKGEPPDVKVLGRLPPELLDYQQQSIDASAANAREISSQNQPPLNNNNNRFANNTGSSSMQHPVQQPTAPNVQDLVKKLFDYKILQIPGAGSSKPSETSTTTSQPPPPITTVPPPTLNKPPPPIVAAIDEPKTPDLTSFDSELLKIKYPAAIKSLYLGQQCATCGNRFPPQQQNGGGATINRYARHLDWHFRQNKKEKLEANKAHSRAWYYSLCEWSLYEELSDEKMPPPSGSAQATGADKNAASSSSGAAASSGIGTDGIAEEDLVDNGETSENGGANNGSANSNAQNSTNQTAGGSLSSGGLGIIGNGIRTCPASDDVDDSCCICNDPFEIFWFAEKEEWHFKDAIRVDNKLYHPICFEDAREEEHNNSSINLSRSQSFMDSETTTNATAAAPTSPSPLNSSDNIDMEHSGLIKNIDNINSDDKLVKVEPL